MFVLIALGAFLYLLIGRLIALGATRENSINADVLSQVASTFFWPVLLFMTAGIEMGRWVARKI